MTLEPLVLSIAGFIIITLLAAIGYFLTQLIQAINDMSETVQELKVIVNGQILESIKNIKETCKERHCKIDESIKDLYNKANE